jgi:hypothetical protein
MHSPDDSHLHAHVSDGLPPEENPAKRSGRSSAWFGPVVAVCLVLIAGAVIVSAVGRVREMCSRSVESSNLRQLGQVALIYASEHQGNLPVAEDVWDYAGKLARDSGIDDATMWYAGMDPANLESRRHVSTVLTADHRGLEPNFRNMKPSWAVPLGQLSANMPATTPLIWTRGLKPDGTWSSDSPNGTSGGHIVFLGGNVQRFSTLTSGIELQRFDGKGKTRNIIEALPPGTRIGEYVPTEAEQFAWATEIAIRPLIFPGIWIFCFLVLRIQSERRKWPTWLLGLFVTASILFAIISLATERVRE